MKKLLLLVMACIMVFSLSACGNDATEETANVEPTEDTSQEVKEEATAEPEAQEDWSYDASSKTLYLNADVGDFEPDAPDFEGTTTNAPWAEYLTEIENIVVEENVSYIGEYAFAFCQNLKNVEVAENATALNFRCFFKCGDWENGSEIYFVFHSNDLPMFGEDVFGYTWDSSNVVVNVPDGHEQHWTDYLGGRGMHVEGYDQGDMNNEINLDDPNSIASVFLNDMQFMTGGTPDSDMKEDFSFVAYKNNSDDGSYVEFGSDGEGAYFTRNEHLNYDSRNNNQAVLFRFMPNDTQDLVFTLMNDNEISMKFNDGVPYHVNMHNFSETPYSDFGPANITLEPDKWYWALMAVDGNGTYRSAVWKEEDPMTGANCQDETGITDGPWKWSIGFGAEQTLYLGEYIVFDFDCINDGMSSNNNNDNGGNSNEDFGPFWSIDICGNFDIMSDMVWQSVEPQDFKIGSGDTFRGYVLKDLMDLSGNGLEEATVVLGDDGGTEIAVNPTYDAFIVYKQNDELMGGPYLLTIDGLSEAPVVQVNP